jgi:ribosome maturation factor RimP
VELQLADGTGLTGRIGDVDGDALRLITRVRSDWDVRQIRLADIAKAVVQVEFSTPGARELELLGQTGTEA